MVCPAGEDEGCLLAPAPSHHQATIPSDGGTPMAIPKASLEDAALGAIRKQGSKHLAPQKLTDY